MQTSIHLPGRRASAFAVATLLTAALLAGPPPAGAEVWHAEDPIGDGGAGEFGTDIVAVKVNHAPRRVYVRIHFDEFVGEHLKGHLDLRGRNAGPEFTWQVATAFAPYPTELYRVDDWGRVFGPGVSAVQRQCKGLRTVRLEADHPVLLTEIPRRCLRLAGALPSRVKVSVVSVDPGGPGDWAPARHTWSPWVGHD